MDGIIIVDKPAGITSHDVVDFIRRRFGVRKAGHAGTLDPFATGVLVMLIGSATRQSDRFSGQDKGYRATMVLGAVSDTGDRDGTIRPVASGPEGLRGYTAEEIGRVFAEFTGEIAQVPPMYSAVKVGGKKMYELARKGVAVERPPRKVRIDSLTVVGIAMPRVTFDTVCSKGTYIRQLSADIGARLGCGAYLEDLKRTRSGGFDIRDAVAFDRLRAMSREEFARGLMRP